ncbi:MAG: DUF362 domain-containing protein [Deltaproteobacteria bacterium]|nr:DUF362 domain-containing protein [Deltaproteobacteria bacterium]
MKQGRQGRTGNEGGTGRPTSRRRFLETTAGAGAAALLGAACGGGGEDPLDAADGAGEAPGDGADAADVPEAGTFDDIPQGRVVLVRAATPAAAVARGIALMNGLTFIRPGQKVMLKPNMTGPIPPPDTTSCAVLAELIRQCNAAGAGEVIVAERTFGPLHTVDVFDWPLCDEGSRSMREVVEEAGAVFRPLDDEPWDEVSPAGAVDFDEPILVPRILTEVDHLINVPALKTHNIAVFTMSLKNFFGLVHPDTRNGIVHGDPRNADDPAREKRMFAQMNLCFHPVLNVMDGILARTTGGPMPPGDVAETNMILLSKDRVALDAVGLAVLRHVGTEFNIESRPVWEQIQLAEAVRVGIGVGGPDEVELVGEGIDELAEIEAELREV